MATPTDGGAGSGGSRVVLLEKAMATKILAKLYSSGTASADQVNVFTMPRAARLVAMQVHARATVTGALSENVQWELSLQSSSQFTQAEAYNVIQNFGLVPFVATAGSQPTLNLNVGGFDVPMAAGQKLYLHRNTGSAFGACIINVVLYFA